MKKMSKKIEVENKKEIFVLSQRKVRLNVFVFVELNIKPIENEA
jgi:hypothetical protein